MNAHTHLELEPLESSRPSGNDESEIPWLRRVIDQRRGRSEQSQKDAVARNVKASIEFGNDLPRRHNDRRAELGVDRRGAATRPGLRRADRAQAPTRARDLRVSLEMAGFGPPRHAGRGLRQAGPEPARSV